MTIAEYQKELSTCIHRQNKVYSIWFKQFSKTEVYVMQITIKPEYQGRGYLKRIFDNLCKEFKSSLIFQCYEWLYPMYKHIGAFTMTNNPHGLIEMYYDPLNINY